MNEKPELTPKDALQYISELVAEYMKTLPPPVRGPVIQAVNASLTKVGEGLETNLKVVANK
jgi:hypothetical protein